MQSMSLPILSPEFAVKCAVEIGTPMTKILCPKSILDSEFALIREKMHHRKLSVLASLLT